MANRTPALIDVCPGQLKNYHATIAKGGQHNGPTSRPSSFLTFAFCPLTSLGALDEEANIQSFGVYQARLEKIRNAQKMMIKTETAATSNVKWTVNGSAAEGRKQIRQMLRAFNHVNQRKEFFGVTIHDIADVVQQHHGEIEFTLMAEARDYRTTLAMKENEQNEDDEITESIPAATDAMALQE